jgi:phosphomannomutase
MTDRVCFIYTCAFLQHLSAIGQFAPGTAVAIAGDLRPSSPRIMAACAAAVAHMGGTVADCGFVPSPAVAAYGFARAIPSLMVTGSHIPDDRNGIKFNRADGEVLKPDETAIRAQTVDVPNLFDADGMLRSAPASAPIDAATPYVARYVAFFGATALSGLKLGVYQHSAVGRDIVMDILAALGAQPVLLARSARFIPVDTEAVRPEDQELARQWAADPGFDAILSTDGDSDRPLLADETGEWLRGDILGILCAQALGVDAVATPVSSNSALELSGCVGRAVRTRIGSPFVIEAMNHLIAQGHIACGYEANGGFILGSPITQDGATLPALPTRDAVLPMLAALVYARRQGLALSALKATLPPRYTASDRLQNYPTAKGQALVASLGQGSQADILAKVGKLFGAIAGNAVAVDQTDGLRTTFASGAVIHLRPSGNAPELRIYTESDTPEAANLLKDKALGIVAAYP